MTRVLIVESNFYHDLAAELAAGAAAELAAQGVRHDRVSVPGALEVPAAIAIIDDRIRDHRRNRRRVRTEYHGYVALGCVIRGETSHYDIVSGESARGLMDLTLRRGLAIGNGILTVDTPAQAWARAGVGDRNKGRDAVRACLSLIALKRWSAG